MSTQQIRREVERDEDDYGLRKARHLEILQTDRLILREMTDSDVDNLLGIFSDPEAMRFYPSTKGVPETEEWIRRQRERYRRHGHGLWIAILKETGEFAGQCGLVLQDVEGSPEIEIGYLFLRRLWGQGLATEAAKGCRDYAFAHFGYNRLVSLIAPANIASRRVAEKVGMNVEKEIIWWGKEALVYSLLKLSNSLPTNGID